MGLIYTVEFENVSITNANGDYDLFYIAPADDRPVIARGWTFDQLTDLGDSEEEVLRLRWIRGHTTVGSGGASATPRPLNGATAAAAGTYRTNDSTIASAGTAVNLYSGGFNVRIGERIFPPRELCPQVSQAQTTMVLRLMAAVTDDLNMSGTLWVEEL